MSGNDPSSLGANAGRTPEAPATPPPPPPPPSTTPPSNLSSSSHQFLAAVRESHEEGAQGFTQQSAPSPSLVQPSSAIKKQAHNRQVSWGMPTTSPPLPPGSGGNPTPLPTWDGTTLSGTKQDKLNINDVINAGGHTEMEAETYILQAVEKITLHQRANTEVSGLYSSIMEDEIVTNLQDSTFDTEEEEVGYDDEQESLKPRPTPIKQASQSTVASNAKFKGLIPKERIESDTVEGTLFGLTSALTELDNETILRSDSALNDEAQVPETTFTSADKLATAAQKMLNEDKDNDDDGNKDVEAHPSAISSSDALGGQDTSSSGDGKRNNDNKRKSGGNRVVKEASNGVKQEWELLNTYFTTRKDSMKANTRKFLSLILIPSFALAFFLYYIVENPELCPVPKKNGTVAPTMPPTMAPSYFPSSSPSVLPSFAPSVGPSSSPSAAPSEWDPFFLSWFGNGTQALNGTNITLPPINVTLAPTYNAPIEVEEPEPEAEEDEEEEKDSIFTLFTVCPGAGASASWWVLFLGVRHVLTLCMALITQSFIIDYLALSSRIMVNTFGPIVTLLVVQSKGWPFILTFWAIYSLILLCGDTAYAHHWGYWQDWIGMFNDDNPSGDVVNNKWNQAILVNAIIIGVAVAIKRLAVGLFLGRQTFAHYGEQLALVMKNMVLVGEVATLARQIEDTKEDYEDHEDHIPTQASMNSNGWKRFVEEADEDDAKDDEPVVASAADAANAFMATRQSAAIKHDVKSNDIHTVASHESAIAVDPEFTTSQQQEMADLLEEWEEPHTAEEKEEKKITIGAVLQFRQALTFMKKKYPFLPAFGPADTREACIASSQQVYDRLLLRTPHLSVLPFETLALLAKKQDGSIDKDKAKEIIRAFRPDRDGTLGKLEWVKSVDVIYKQLRLLSANISNSSQMDAAVENLINIVFYIALGAVIIYRLGEDPLALFLSFSSVILAFAFMFGKSSSKYFDGCLFILVQRPYGVGDRVHLSNPQTETSPSGSSGWIVEKVSLFTTSVYWGTTNERATLCNGAISNLRVINAARSPNATVFVDLKFGIDTEYEKIEIFRTAVEQYLKDRPREWLTFVGFRPTEVAPDKGYIGYKVIAQHRNSWQVIGSIIESKANLTTYCLEVSKQLEMRFLSPPLPVDLTMKDDNGMALPMLGDGDPLEAEVMTGYAGAPTPLPSAQETGDGLRHRRGKSRFAELVSMALEANKTK